MFTLSMPHFPIDTENVLFDISRLARNHDHKFGTGVDRIDLAVGLNLVETFGERCRFVYAGRRGTTFLPGNLGRALLDHLNSSWNDSGPGRMSGSLVAQLRRRMFLGSMASLGKSSIAGPDTTYVVASHSGVPRIPGGLARLDPKGTMKRLVYIHDLIPLEMPEYQRLEARDIFAAYLREATRAPVSFVSNSQDTDDRLRRMAGQERWPVERFLVAKPELTIRPATPRTASPRVRAYIEDPRPFFTIVGTIEPRKNHLLLLNLWRDFAAAGLPVRLCIVGKRGWENENVVDMLDRCAPIKDTVTEFSGLADSDVQILMQSGKALLFPSFCEGLGIPLLEAHALGAPCIVSDIPVFREIAPEGTVFLDPLDGLGWKRAILDKVGL